LINKKAYPGIGLWKLVSYESRDEDGTVTYPAGKDGTGQIGYDAKGNMWAQVAEMHRPDFASGDSKKGTPTEIKAALEGYTAYFGTYEFDEGKKAVTHHVKSSLYPNWNGTDHVRYFEFAGNRMTLRTAPMRIGGHDVIGTLVWERIA
jgi:hypothetical protein